MAKILITSGPTRQYIDPVRFISNASSGRMGAALAAAALRNAHQVVIVSGPVEVEYPAKANVIRVTTTDDMLRECLQVFPSCDGLIAAAAPCDYRPAEEAKQKLHKTGSNRTLTLVETPDILTTLTGQKGHRWTVGFALETEDVRNRAHQKLLRKGCDLIVANSASAISSSVNQIEILDRSGAVVGSSSGAKDLVAQEIIRVLHERFEKGK